jgi:hypothetical protein
MDTTMENITTILDKMRNKLINIIKTSIHKTIETIEKYKYEKKQNLNLLM